MPEQKILLDVSSLFSRQIGAKISFPLREKIKTLTEEIKPLSPLEGNVFLTLLGEKTISVLVKAEIKVSLICSRCLDNFSYPIHLTYEEIFSFNKQEGEFIINSDKTIDLYPSIAQEILLAIPIKPLCQKQCRLKQNKY